MSTRTSAAPAASPESRPAQGVAFGLTAYVMWGCFPLFFALFDGVPAFEILIHRILWSCLFLAGLVTLLGRWAPIREALAHPRELGRVGQSLPRGQSPSRPPQMGTVPVRGRCPRRGGGCGRAGCASG